MSENNRKTAKQKAQETLEKYDKKVQNLTKRHAKALAEASRLEEELEEAKAERSYAASHPLLQETATLDVGDSSDEEVQA